MSAPRVLRPLLALAAVSASLAMPASAAAADCAGQDLQPSAANLAQAEAATLCLVNAERSARGLPALRSQAQLRTAAVKHSADMVDQGYFSHDSLDGRDFTDRIDETGYIPTRGRWHVGENIGWGGGELGSPLLMMRGWMNSPAHRDNLLDRNFREIGIGIAAGAPATTPFAGATYTTDFGARPDRDAAARKGDAAAKKKKAAKKKRKAKKCKRGKKTKRCRKARRTGSKKKRIMATIRNVKSFR
jgi:uncharacterized protein YkwD